MKNKMLQIISDMSGDDSVENAQALVTEWGNNTDVDFDDTDGIWVAQPARGHWLRADDKAEFTAWLVTRFG